MPRKMLPVEELAEDGDGVEEEVEVLRGRGEKIISSNYCLLNLIAAILWAAIFFQVLSGGANLIACCPFFFASLKQFPLKLFAIHILSP